MIRTRSRVELEHLLEEARCSIHEAMERLSRLSFFALRGVARPTRPCAVVCVAAAELLCLEEHADGPSQEMNEACAVAACLQVAAGAEAAEIARRLLSTPQDLILRIFAFNPEAIPQRSAARAKA